MQELTLHEMPAARPFDLLNIKESTMTDPIGMTANNKQQRQAHHPMEQDAVCEYALWHANNTKIVTVAQSK